MTTNHDTQTDTGARAGIIKLGLDVHASSIVVVRQIDAQVPQPAQRFTPEQFVVFARRQVERPHPRVNPLIAATRRREPMRGLVVASFVYTQFWV